MNDTRLSVAMCTYNGARFLREQLQSIASQETLPDEMVICDDGSTDDTITLLRTFSDSAPFQVRIVSNKERLGSAKHFEKSISLCNGTIIILADQDDIWKPNKLKKLDYVFDQNPDAQYAFSDADMIDEDGSPLGFSTWDAFGFQGDHDRFVDAGQLRVLLKSNVVIGASMAIRASLRDVAVPIPPGWMHDYWIALLGSALSRGVPIPERLLMYRRHAGQVCGWRKKGLGQAIKESIGIGDTVVAEKAEQFREVLRRIEVVQECARCPQNRVELLNQKEVHLMKRAALRSSRTLPRLAGVLAEASTGRYQLFSNSWWSIGRDLSWQGPKGSEGSTREL
jgi:glycosyltransferase involved in cell wall biosynthesis